MASSIPSGTDGHAVRLQKIDDARQHQNERWKGRGNSYVGQAEAYQADGNQATYLQVSCNGRRTAAVAAQETLSPSNSSNSSPRKLLQSRRQNMMQRRIEMRQRSEEQQRQQQQMKHSNGRLPSCNNQNPLTGCEATQIHSQPQYQVEQQARHMLHSQSRRHQLNMNSILRGHHAQRNDSSVHHQDNVSYHRQFYPQTYPTPSHKQIRPPNHSNPPTNLHHPHRNSHPGTQHQRQSNRCAQERQPPPPAVISPPELDRKQNMLTTMRNAGEDPSANFFHTYKNNRTGNYHDHGEGIEVEAQYFLQPPSSQENACLLPSSRESPSDECLVEEGYYEDQYQKSPNEIIGNHEQQEFFEETTHATNPPQQLSKKQITQQQTQHSGYGFRHQRTPMVEPNEKKHNQSQPDWHQLNRNRLQKKFAARFQTAASNSSPNYRSQSLQQTRPLQIRKTSIANFSPIESLSTRTDQIQRKHRQPLHSSDEPMESIDPLHNGHDQRHGLIDEGEESDASVLDRARSFEANYVGNNKINVGVSRSRSVPRERTSQWSPSQSHQPHNKSRSFFRDHRFGDDRRRPRVSLPSQEVLTQYIDDDTVTESVASRKKEWEGKFQSGQRSKTKPPPENEAFSVWVERADRLAQQRKSELLNEQRKCIEEKWRRSAVKSLPPERRNHERGSEVYGHDARYSEERGYRTDEYQFVAHDLGRDQHSIEQDASHMSIEDRRRMLWDGKERLRAVLPKTFSFESANGMPENSSPGTVGSAGSTLFKSKFVHAAAVATQQKSNFEEDVSHTKRVISPKRHLQKAGAVSSHFTDSTAGTTPVGSNGSSSRTHGTSVSRMVDLGRIPPEEYSNQMPPHHYNNYRHKQVQTDSRSKTEKTQPELSQGHGNKMSVMPSIAETPRSSVADLIARINAVSRSNPAEALAAIDCIIKAESGASSSMTSRPVQQAQSSLSPRRPSESKTIQPRTNDFLQSKNEKVAQDVTEHSENEEEDESFVSSDDSTVSSMTNPTYLSVPAHSPLSEAHRTEQIASKPQASSTGSHETKKQPQYSPHHYHDYQVKTSKSAKKNTEAAATAQSRLSNTYSLDQNQKSDVAIGSEEVTGKGSVVKTTVGGESHRLTVLRSTSKSKSKDERLRSNNEEENLNKQLPNNINNADNAWVTLPENKYFKQASITNQHQHLTFPRQKGDVKPSIDSPAQHQQKSESKYISHSELSQGQSIGLPSVVSDAFSGIDIDLDNGTDSNLVNHQPHETVSQAFSGVDIDLELNKTVSQRRQELEYISRSWNQKSPGGEGNKRGDLLISRENKISSKVASRNTDRNQDWAVAPEDKKKAKIEPTLRLKGSKKLAQKFANLVKAFESDAH